MKNIYSLLGILLLFIIVFISHIIHHRNYNSYKQQTKLYKDINTSSFKNTKPEFYENLELEIPNLTVTSLPIKAIKAVYIRQNETMDSLQKSIDLLYESIKDNPFIMYSEGHLSQVYYGLKKYDSAYYYARKSFLGLPKNAVHFAMISKLHANLGNYDSIVKTFNKIKSPPREDITRIYFASMLNFIDKVDDSLKSSVVETAKFSKNFFLTDNELQLLADYIIEGREKVDKAIVDQEKGMKFLSENNYIKGIEFYKKALSVRKNNVGYIQTIGLAYHNIGEHKKAIENLSFLEDKGVPLDPISLYVKGLSHYHLKDKVTSCEYFLKSSKFGLENAKTSYNNLCKY